MAKVSTKLGFTLKLSKEASYEFVRGDIEISEIDTEGNVKEQLENAVKALDVTWDVTQDQADKKILSEVKSKTGAEYQLQVTKKFAELEKMIKEISGQLPKKSSLVSGKK